MSRQVSELSLYRALLDLSEDDDPERVLPELLTLAVGVTGARLGYIAVGEAVRAPRWWHAVGANPEAAEALPDRVSTTILEQAVSDGQIVATVDASRDPRLRAEPSVRAQRIEQVLCAPVRGGVLYLQGRTEPAPFADEDIALLRVMVRHLAPLFARVRAQARWRRDATAKLRTVLSVADIVGRSAALAAVFERLRLVSGLNVPVLFTGRRAVARRRWRGRCVAADHGRVGHWFP